MHRRLLSLNDVTHATSEASSDAMHSNLPLKIYDYGRWDRLTHMSCYNALENPQGALGLQVQMGPRWPCRCCWMDSLPNGKNLIAAPVAGKGAIGSMTARRNFCHASFPDAWSVKLPIFCPLHTSHFFTFLQIVSTGESLRISDQVHR